MRNKWKFLTKMREKQYGITYGMIYAYEKRSLKLIRMKFDKNHQMPKPSSEIKASVSARD